MNRLGDILPSAIIIIVCMVLILIISLLFPDFLHFILLLIALILTASGVKSFISHKQRINWLEGEATIKTIIEQTYLDPHFYGGSTTYFYPEIEYIYTVDGKSLEGSIVSSEKENIWVTEYNNFGDLNSNENRWWIDLKPGDKLPVFINPENFKEAVLVKDFSDSRKSHHLALIVGGLLLLGAWVATQITY